MDQTEFHHILQSINLDLLYHVAERTFLSPFFACWIPLIAYGQSAPRFLRYSTLLLIFVILRAILRYSSQAWRNRRWAPTQIDWSDQIILITGASRGLGRVLAETLLLKHLTVVVLDVHPYSHCPGLDQGDLHFYQCDVSDPQAIQSVARRIRQEIGPPTILVNNAAIVHSRPIVELESSEIQKTFGVNVLSHFYLIKEFLPNMIERRSGHIVTIASVLGHVGVSRVSDYCASKAAAILLHRSLRQELNTIYNSPTIRTTLVCPGYINTKLFENVKMRGEFFFPRLSAHEVMKKIVQAIDSEDSRDIYIPLYTRLGPFFGFESLDLLLLIVPSWVIDALYWLTGANRAFDPSSQPETPSSPQS